MAQPLCPLTELDYLQLMGLGCTVVGPGLFLYASPVALVYSWNFHLAPVSVPLLGADFLQHFDLLVNVKGF